MKIDERKMLPFKPEQRVRLSPLGHERLSRHRDKLGRAVGASRDGLCLRVRWDGYSCICSIHKTFMEGLGE